MIFTGLNIKLKEKTLNTSDALNLVIDTSFAFFFNGARRALNSNRNKLEWALIFARIIRFIKVKVSVTLRALKLSRSKAVNTVGIAFFTFS